MLRQLLILYYLFIIIQSKVLKCGDEEIENCEECGTGDNSNTCIKCKDKHFLFFNNLYCLPCDDEYYGQIGCGGNCKAINFNKERFVECNLNDCKTGYINLNGICVRCSDESPNCKTCDINVEIDNKNQKNYSSFICKECISNEFKINKYGQCQRCYMNNCKKCNYNNNYSKTECEECYDGYYLSSNKTCEKCKEINIRNGYCTVCSDNKKDYKSEDCRCNSYYTKKDNLTCVKCPSFCNSCNFNISKNITECKNCDHNYILNYNKTCSYCGDGCNSCKLGKDLNPSCTSCDSGYILFENKCLKCQDNCDDCKIGNKNKTICNICKNNYILDSNGICQPCKNCKECYIKENGKTACSSCYEYDILNKDEQCIKCNTIKSIGGEGCLECEYNKEKNKYECINCYYGYIPIINDKICKKPKELNLSNDCLEAKNIGTEEKPIYSCIKCNDYTANITNSKNINNCYERDGELAYCLEGIIDKNNNIKCTKCITNGHFKKTNICECNSDSFGKYGQCYKCNDSSYGNIGCEPSKGCKYSPSNDQLTCNQCKNDFYEYTKGECFSCSDEIQYCNKCSLDSKEQFKCEDCILDFIYNKEEESCELLYEEYPEIAPGCIIFNKNNTYKSQKKCQICKPGYFKTKDESCILCKSEKYGGPSCEECEYEKDKNGKETEKIKCKICEKNYETLNSEGKCYNCKTEISESCDSCKFIKNGKDEKLVCTLCSPGYYLDSNGNCVNYLEYIEKIPNCNYMIYNIGNISFEYHYNDNNIFYDFFYYNNNSYYSYLFYYIFGNDNFTEFINKNIKEIKTPIKGHCESCISGYYLNDKGMCIELTIENCTINSIIQDNSNLFYRCKDLCYNKKYALVVLDNNFSYCENCTYIEIIGIESLIGYYRYNYLNNYKINETENELKYLGERTLCFDNSGKGGKNSPENLKYCHIAKYIENEDKYICIKCLSEYTLEFETNLCKRRIKQEDIKNCNLENIGTKNNPIYSCKKCSLVQRYYGNDEENYDDYYNYMSSFYYDIYHYIMVKENNISFCVNDNIEEINNCLDAVVDTTYVKYKYNCTKCSFNYLPFNSKFFGRKICQNIYENITTEKIISLDNFNDIENIPAQNGKCIKNTLFTPDNKYCYECNNKDIGMPGCKGSCSFSLKRNDVIKCEGECDNGYIESSEGVCEPCDNINKGCYECHYENEYPKDYIGIKTKRRFVCDLCEDDYIKNDGKCYHCSDNQKNCEKCVINSNNEFTCTKCGSGYYLDQNEICQKCNLKDQFILGTNKCVQCNDFDNGGIKGCKYCEKNEDKIICNLCGDNYILLTNNNTCLKRSGNNELKQFEKCEKLTLDKNNKLYCSRCKKEFSLLKENNIEECNYIPIIYDGFYNYFDYRELYLNITVPIRKGSIYENYYYENIYDDLEPCQEATNIGKEDKPLYTCNKCYNIFEYDKIYENENILLLDEKTNISYCINNNKLDLTNCTKAIKKAYGKQKVYSCIQCAKDNILIYNYETNISYCQSMNTTNKCMVKYCKKCKSGNNYVCDTCISSDYVVNSASGSCVKKTDIVPAITWKDIFRLQMNSVKEINGRNIYGPSLRLRGITNSQINSRHSFLIYLTFKIKQQKRYIRNLEEDTIKIPTICEIINGVEKTNNDINMVDYECIGESNNIENLHNYQLIDIEEGNNVDTLKKSNIKELATTTKLSALENKKNPNFKLNDVYKNKTLIPFLEDNESTMLISNESSKLYKDDNNSDNDNDNDSGTRNKSSSKKNNNIRITVFIGIGLIILLIIISIIICCCCCRKKKKQFKDIDSNSNTDISNNSKENITSFASSKL